MTIPSLLTQTGARSMKTRFLLDTCAIIYLTEERIAESARLALRDSFAAGEVVRVSAISAWEIGLLVANGRLSITVPPGGFFDTFMALAGMALEATTPEIFIASSFLPAPIHRDPADRIIVATARALDLTVVTSDRLILDYAAKGHVRALAC